MDVSSPGCGQKAALFLDQLIAERPVVCQRRDTDRFRRIVAVCRSGPQDLGGAMVEAGWALAYTRYSRAYVGAQERAARGGRGLWQGHFEPPWEWRRR
ncbi:MAG: thermonuclease family protein [Alphaproteobacteria bacterium]|nr:thermonuclease family protein [Alphaproteobacteria bacterium]